MESSAQEFLEAPWIVLVAVAQVRQVKEEVVEVAVQVLQLEDEAPAKISLHAPHFPMLVLPVES